MVCKLKTQFTGHFILYEVLQASTGRSMEEFAITRGEPDHEKELKRELNNLANESGVCITDLQWRPIGKH